MNQTENQIRIQIFYEISMAIGRSLDLERMLKTALSAYLRKLSCAAGMVLELKPSGPDSYCFAPCFAIPRNAQGTASGRAVLRQVPAFLIEPELEVFRRRLPLDVAIGEGRQLHIFELPGFGLLTLAKSGDELDRSTRQSIVNLNRKLAESCIACRKSEQLQQVLEDLEATVAERTVELTEALEKVKTLSGLVPICSHCKNVRDDSGYWDRIENYIQEHSEARFSHGICPDCVKKRYPGLSEDD